MSSTRDRINVLLNSNLFMVKYSVNDGLLIDKLIGTLLRPLLEIRLVTHYHIVYKPSIQFTLSRVRERKRTLGKGTTNSLVIDALSPVVTSCIFIPMIHSGL